MSSKQLARTVVDGRKIALSLPYPQDKVEGYLAGMDDFHWLVLDPNGQQHLIHKGSASRITLADEPTYQDEPERELLERIVGPFRSSVERIYFGRSTPPARELSV